MPISIPLIETNHFRYIYINPTSNLVHLLIPFITDTEIRKQNGNTSFFKLSVFFKGGALKELESYKSMLQCHLSLLEESDAHYHIKKERLEQINIYFEALVGMWDTYPTAVQNFFSHPSNLYNIQLRPRTQNLHSDGITSISVINSGNDHQGKSLSLSSKGHLMFVDTETSNEHHNDNNVLIYIDASHIIPPIPQNKDYLAKVRQEACVHHEILSPQDEPVVTIDIEPLVLIDKLNFIDWEKLPKEVVDACHALPAFKVSELLDNVAKGKEDESDAILKSFEDKQTLLRTSGKLTDYSGRTFHCTAYEYAWWAKDGPMRKMLENHMDHQTKALLLEKIDQIECSGLTYQQHGREYKNAHYDMSFILKDLSSHEFNQLKTILEQSSEKFNTATLENYKTISFTADEYENIQELLQNKKSKCISFFYTSSSDELSNKLKFDFHSLITALDIYATFCDTWDYHQQKKEWMNVGKAQRDVPALLAHEYCRPGRMPNIDASRAEQFSRTLNCHVYNINDTRWYPLSIAPPYRLGVDFAYVQAQHLWQEEGMSGVSGTIISGAACAMKNLQWIRHLDNMNIIALTESRENLVQAANQLSLSP